MLITERVDDGPFRGLWEFPGGKIKPLEAPETALARELVEEIGIEPVCSEVFMHVAHEYPDRRVSIEFHLVREWKNKPAGLEGQAIRWVSAEDLRPEHLLPADLPVVEALRALANA